MEAPCTKYSPEERKQLKETILPLLGDLERVGLELCRSPQQTEELVAETVAKACEKFHTLRDHSKAKQWLLRILTNQFISKYRSKKTRREITYDEASEEPEQFSLFDELSQPVFWWGNPEQEVITKFVDNDFREAIGLLNEESRTIVIMCDVEGYSYDEIASIMDIPVGTVRSRLSRARSELQKKLYNHAIDMGWVSNRGVEQRTTADENE
ncbi:MAG: sigma-70 family RNA polymerase sigma factor [Ignavibacteria bacterium]|nr:sigma-70 family RNA polymerase sigma factor [Ignavibacteria bacterium]